jgi:hypothetical protein
LRCLPGRAQNRYNQQTPNERTCADMTATLNWPTHRGTASAFPLAAFGLSAFFYTLIAGLAFPGDTSALLLFFSFGTSMLVLASLPFLHVVDHKTGTGYAVLPTSDRTRRDSNLLHRTKSSSPRTSTLPQPEPSKPPTFPLSMHLLHFCPLPLVSCQRHHLVFDEQDGDSDETSSLLSGPGDILPEDDATSTRTNRSHCLDITGLALLYKIEFWQLWILMGLLTGVGLMTIK